MKSYSKEYDLEEDGFEGSIECYLADTSKENLRNWLESEVQNGTQIYNTLKELTHETLILKNLYIDEKYRGQGFGLDAVSEVLSDSYTPCAILVCDTHEEQRKGFNLESFYKELGFETITLNETNQPLMVYPKKIAHQLIQKLNDEQPIPTKKRKI